MNFIDSYVKYTSIYESSTAFWKWSAYAAIASVLRDNCYKLFADVPVYPNIYVLLLATSAVHRKGNPVSMCERLVNAVKNTKVISGRSSIQAVLDELARGESDPTTGKILKGGSALWVAPELSAGIVNDPEAVKILTDIYDFKQNYTSRLRGTGTFHIKNVCFSMMAASNEDLLRDVYDTKAIFGGLLGRTFLIKPDEFRPSKSLFDAPIRNNGDGDLTFTHLVHLLGEISMLQGQFNFSHDAVKEYEAWYVPFRESYRNKHDKSGVAGRLHTGIIKLSMILCANYQRDLYVLKEHMEQAIVEASSLLPNYQQFVMASGKSTISEVGTLIITALYEAHEHTLSRAKVLQRFVLQISAEQLDEVVTTLEQAKLVVPVMTDDGISYKLTEICIEKLFEKEQKEKK